MRLRNGIWVNDGGSELHLSLDGTHAGGFYITAAERVEKGKKHPITGWVNGDLIGFVVSWESCNSLTSWCGRYDVDGDGREHIKTIWHLGRMFEDKANTIPNPVWSTFISNTCTYYLKKDTSD